LPSLTPRLNPHRARGTDGAHSPAISCLGAFPTPVSERVADLLIAGVRKPAHNRTFPVSVWSGEDADPARSIANLGTLGEANPRLRRADADLELAQQNLNFTKVWAPVEGYITNLQLGVGDSAVANQPIVAVIDTNSFYVEAFFRETFVANLQIEDRAVVTL